jgi:hemerythrin
LSIRDKFHIFGLSTSKRDCWQTPQNLGQGPWEPSILTIWRTAMPIIWESKLDTGIDVIDHQHRRIVDYINDLEIAKAMGDKKKVTDVIEQLIDYTQSHFGFEESMMEEAGYKFLKPHKKVHELFIKRVTDFTMRAAKGEDIADELHSMLAKWLINHIASEDRDYSDTVKSMVGAEAAHHEVATQRNAARPGFISGLLGRFFR